MSRIIIDARPLQTPGSRDRGIDFSLKGWLTEFLRLPYTHDVSLLIDPRLAAPGVPLTGDFWRTTPFESYPEIFRIPDPDAERVAQENTDRFLREQQADLAHFPSPFETVVTIGVMPTACRVVATFHDALPVFFPEYYLGSGDAYAASYWTKLQSLRRATRIIADSRSAADDLELLTGIPAESIDVVHYAPSPEMLIQPKPEASRQSPVLQTIGQPYVFAVLGENPSKNAETLVAAFSRLPPEQKSRYKLVITYRIPEWHRQTVQSWLSAYHTSDRVIFTDWVGPEDLRLLFANAELYVHPTLYEGYGMPIVEAMALGKPVIASDVSSIPEVAGGAALLIDPYDVNGIAKAIERVLSDPDLRSDMSARSVARARQFTWQQAAQAVQRTYDRALSQSPVAVASRTTQAAPANDAQSCAQALVEKAKAWDQPPAIRSWFRRNLTMHMREAYFDPLIERQSVLNRTLGEAIRNLAGRLAYSEQPAGESHPSQSIVDSSARTALGRPLNAYLLAGPLPEFGYCLGYETYQQLHTAGMLSLAQLDETRSRQNAVWLAETRRLARETEELAEQIRQKALRTNWLQQHIDEPGRQVARLAQGGVKSRAPVIGGLIAWIRRNATSHVQLYVDYAMERQVRFNQLARDWLCRNSLILIGQMKFNADIVWHDYAVSSNLPVVGPLIAWMRRGLTSHLFGPHIVPTIERQAVFNRALVEALSAIGKLACADNLREHAEIFEHKALLKRQAAELETRLAADGSLSGLDMDDAAVQAAFTDQLEYVLRQIDQRL